MKYLVGVAEMKISDTAQDVIVTQALGSCIGIAIHDSAAYVGGIIHYMLPEIKFNKSQAEKNPFMFGDSGIPLMLEKIFELGAVKSNLRVIIAGGASVLEQKGFFDIGMRNILIARDIFKKNDIKITKEHIGGYIPRILYLEIGAGHTWLTTGTKKVEL